MASPQPAGKKSIRSLQVPLERSAPQRLDRHPKTPRTQSWKRWALGQKKPRVVDLFCGCGGLSLGLEQAGYVTVLSIDNDPWALETHRHNLPGTALDLDLSDPERVDSLVGLLEGVPIDLIAGGPPCQPFSRAGRSKIRSLVEDGIRPERDERTHLWQSYLEVVERVKPAGVMMENVPDMALGDDLTVLRVLTARLEKIGYDVDTRLLDAWRYGVPQHRQRLILIARLDGRPLQWPKEQKPVTLREAIADLPALEGGTGEPEMRALAPKSAFQKRARAKMNGRKLVWDHVTRPVRKDDLEAFRLMKPGTRYSELPEHLRRYRSDIFNDKYNRLPWDDLCRSITAHMAKDGYWYIHPGEDRTLTVRESARVQTFPDHFRFAGTRSHAWRQIGNAVPPALGEAVGRALLAAGKKKPLTKTRRPSHRIAELRRQLLAWAASDAANAPWRHPGDPWQVLAGVVLGDRVGVNEEGVERFLEQFPRPRQGLSTKIRAAAKKEDGTTKAGYMRLARTATALGCNKTAWTRDRWAKAAALGGAEESLVRTIGLGEDRVLNSASMLRVASRLCGDEFVEERKLTDGRMALGRIVGAVDGPTLTAAIHALGRALCTPQDPDCKACPVKSDCESRNRKSRK
jgi:DNA (cytosine-5)-methyltransferase 1